MRLLRRLARLATITALLGGTAALVAATSPAASAAPAAGPDGWVRIAHLSPQAPAMDMYVYPFGNPGHPVVLSRTSVTVPIMPAGAISAGFGGTAPRPPTNPVPWLVMIAAGALLAVAGLARMRRPA